MGISEGKIIQGILTHSNHQITEDDANKFHDYLYKRTLKYLVGCDEELLETMNDIGDLTEYGMDEIAGEWVRSAWMFPTRFRL